MFFVRTSDQIHRVSSFEVRVPQKNDVNRTLSFVIGRAVQFRPFHQGNCPECSVEYYLNSHRHLSVSFVSEVLEHHNLISFREPGSGSFLQVERQHISNIVSNHYFTMSNDITEQETSGATGTPLTTKSKVLETGASMIQVI